MVKIIPYFMQLYKCEFIYPFNLLNKIFNEDKMQSKIVKCKTMEEAFNIIKSYPLMGNFMAYQLVTDINYKEKVKRP